MAAKKAAAAKKAPAKRSRKEAALPKLTAGKETLAKLKQVGQQRASPEGAAGFFGVTEAEFSEFIEANPSAKREYELGFAQGAAGLHQKEFEAAKGGNLRAIEKLSKKRPASYWHKNRKPLKRPLTKQQHMAVMHYCEHGRLTDAYIHAYPHAQKWRPQAKHVEASRFFAIPEVIAAVNDLQSKLRRMAEDRFLITEERILAELARIAFANMQDLVTIDGDTGEPKFDPSKMTRDHFAAVSEVTVEEFDTGRKSGKRTKFRMHDKKSALVEIGKHIGMWKEQPANINVINMTVTDVRESIQRKLARIAEQRGANLLLEHADTGGDGASSVRLEGVGET